MIYLRTFCLLLVVMAVSAGQVMAQSYSVDVSGFTATPLLGGGGGAAPDDIFTPPGVAPPTLPIPPIGIPGFAFPPIEVNGLSYGRPLAHFSPGAPAHFSVDFGTISVVGTATGVEFSNPAGSEASSDVFRSTYTLTNSLVFDGNGVATGANPAVPGLALAEPVTQPPPGPLFTPTFDDLDGLDLRSPSALGPVSPTGAIYFTVDFATAGGGIYGAGITAGDVLIGDGTGLMIYDMPAGPGLPPLSPGGVPQPYALESMLGFPVLGNDIDALVVYDNGDGMYTPGLDIIAFSLAPGSAYLGFVDPLTGLTVEPSDILVDGTTAAGLLGSPMPFPAVLHPGESLGLITGRSSMGMQIDNLNALDIIIPEPSTLSLLLLGLVTMSRRRK